MEFISKIYGLLATFIGEIFRTIKSGFEWVLAAIDVQAWLNKFWIFLQDGFYWVANAIILEISHLLDWVSGLLPTFTVPTIASQIPANILHAINWVLPVDMLVTCVSLLITSTVAYFTVGILARWLKVAA